MNVDDGVVVKPVVVGAGVVEVIKIVIHVVVVIVFKVLMVVTLIVVLIIVVVLVVLIAAEIEITVDHVLVAMFCNKELV